MKKHLTEADINAMTDQANHLASEMRDAVRLLQSNNVDRIDDLWLKVPGLQNLVMASAELSGALVFRLRIQQQQDDLTKLKQG